MRNSLYNGQGYSVLPDRKRTSTRSPQDELKQDSERQKVSGAIGRTRPESQTFEIVACNLDEIHSDAEKTWLPLSDHA